MRENQVIRSKNSKFIIRSKFIVGSNFLGSTVFFIYQYFIETITIDIDKFLQALLQSCNNDGFAAIFELIILFCPLLNDWILCTINVVRQETWSYSIWFGKWSIIMHIVFQISDVLRFDCTVYINVLINISPVKVKESIFFNSKHRVHEYASGLTLTPKVELFCSCKRRKFIGQNKVKICKL